MSHPLRGTSTFCPRCLYGINPLHFFPPFFIFPSSFFHDSRLQRLSRSAEVLCTHPNPGGRYAWNSFVNWLHLLSDLFLAGENIK